MVNNTANDKRRPLYAKIAIARKQLGMDEDIYRELIENYFGTRRASDLNWHQLSRLVEILAGKGAAFTSKGKPQKPPRVSHHARSDFYHVADDEFGPTKRMICAIWHKLGYDMTSLDTRCQREFRVESFAWLRNAAKLKRLLTDLEARERRQYAARLDTPDGASAADRAGLE